jgi:hypothetical protein
MKIKKYFRSKTCCRLVILTHQQQK